MNGIISKRTPRKGKKRMKPNPIRQFEGKTGIELKEFPSLHAPEWYEKQSLPDDKKKALYIGFDPKTGSEIIVCQREDEEFDRTYFEVGILHEGGISGRLLKEIGLEQVPVLVEDKEYHHKHVVWQKYADDQVIDSIVLGAEDSFELPEKIIDYIRRDPAKKLQEEAQRLADIVKSVDVIEKHRRGTLRRRHNYEILEHIAKKHFREHPLREEFANITDKDVAKAVRLCESWFGHIEETDMPYTDFLVARKQRDDWDWQKPQYKKGVVSKIESFIADFEAGKKTVFDLGKKLAEEMKKRKLFDKDKPDIKKAKEYVQAYNELVSAHKTLWEHGVYLDDSLHICIQGDKIYKLKHHTRDNNLDANLLILNLLGTSSKKLKRCIYSAMSLFYHADGRPVTQEDIGQKKEFMGHFVRRKKRDLTSDQLIGVKVLEAFDYLYDYRDHYESNGWRYDNRDGENDLDKNMHMRVAIMRMCGGQE